LISEHGDFMTDTTGGKRQWTAGGLYGWSMGTDSNSYNGNKTDNRFFNCTTIRYTINRKTGWPKSQPGTSNSNGDCSLGVCSDNGNNIPLNSGHANGVNAVFGDGSVRFLPNSLPLATLAELATR